MGKRHGWKSEVTCIVITEVLEMNHRTRQWKVSPRAVTGNALLCAEHFRLSISCYWLGKYSCTQKVLAFLSFSVRQKGKSQAAIFSFSFSEEMGKVGGEFTGGRHKTYSFSFSTRFSKSRTTSVLNREKQKQNHLTWKKSLCMSERDLQGDPSRTLVYS